MYDQNMRSRIEYSLKECRSAAEVEKTMTEILSQFGFFQFDFSLPSDLFLFSSIPRVFRQEYIDGNYLKYDLRIEYLLSNTSPIYHTKLYSPLEAFPYQTEWLRTNKKIREMVETMHCREGVYIPLRTPTGIASLSIFARNPDKFRDNVARHIDSLKMLLNSVYYYGYRRFYANEFEEEMESLSPRQIEVLQQFAIHGSCAKMVAKTLSISNRTVEKHAQSIRRIMGVNSTYQAIRKGAKKGLIKIN